MVHASFAWRALAVALALTIPGCASEGDEGPADAAPDTAPADPAPEPGEEATVPGAQQEVSLVVRPETVAPGDSITLVLDNGSTALVAYNLCTSTLERREGQAWVALPSERICTMELRTLASDDEVSYAYDLPAGIEAGAYRAVTAVELGSSGERAELRSEPFEVR